MFIYLIVNHITGKYYVGQHKGDNLKKYLQKKFYEADKHLGGRSHLYASMRKHGREAFSIHALLSDVQTRPELDAYEKDFIAFLRSQDPEYGYNICRGGEGFTGPHTEEWKRNMSQNNPRYWTGKKRSPETIEKMRQSALSRGIGGWDQSPEAIKNRVATRRARGNYGIHRVGKHDSPETRERKRASMLAHSVNWPSQLELQEMVSRTSKRAVGRFLGASATSVRRHLTTKMDFRSHNQRRFLGSFQ